MMKFLLLLGAVLSLASSVHGRRIEDADNEYIPIQGRMGGASRGSSCIIRQRSIDVDEDDDVGSAKQLVGGSSIYIPGALGDGASSAESGEDDADDEEVEGSQEEEDDEYPDYGGGMPPQMQYPVQYGGGMRPGPGYQQYSAPSETALSVSSEPSFGYDQEQYSGDTYKRKRRKPSKPKKRKGGNINCIIITKGGGQKVAKKKPFKLFGWIPLSRRRRSIANHIKAFKSQ